MKNRNRKVEIMNRLFISCENDFPKLITRNRAKGHKSLVIDDTMLYACILALTLGMVPMATLFS